MTGRIGTTITRERLRAAFQESHFTTSMAHEIGITPSQLASAVQASKVHRIRRDLYVVAAEQPRLAAVGEQIGDAVRHADRGARIAAAVHIQRYLREASVEAILAGRSAAEYWELPVLGVRGPLPPPVPSFCIPPGALRAGERSGMRIRYEDLPADHVHRAHDGTAVTGPLRTAIDVVRLGRIPRHLALATLCSGVRKHVELTHGVADSYEVTELAQRPAVRDRVAAHLLEVLDASPRWGARSVRRCLPAIDPRIETALEAVSWGRFHDAGVPLPTPQDWVVGASGTRWRVDFHWRELRLVGEADGRVKYAAGKGLWEEKERELDIAGTGRHVMRWGWRHALNDHDPLFSGMYRALSRAAA